jgi:hypothetical protein
MSPLIGEIIGWTIAAIGGVALGGVAWAFVRKPSSPRVSRRRGF